MRNWDNIGETEKTDQIGSDRVSPKVGTSTGNWEVTISIYPV